VYFQHPNDPRDRLGAEFSFLRFAWDAGVRCVPQPFACDRHRGLGLYQFIEGRPIAPTSLGPSHVAQAIEFFHELNRHKSDTSAGTLREGSEACFTLAQHLHCVERRMTRIDQIDRSTPTGQEAAALADGLLRDTWERIRQGVMASASEMILPLDQPIPAGDRCLSPSDFGFHNALELAGRLTFLDFEYAGWDDPAKTVCDFFCQPAVPVSESYFGQVARAFTNELSDPPMHLHRIVLLLPVYRVKWCCIMRNDFLPVGSERRAFAKDAEHQEQRRREQLEKVRASLDKIM
jgi:hypothetical protein